MVDVASIVNGVSRVTFLLLALTFLGWAFYPEYRTELMGLIVGGFVGLVNVRYLAAKVKQLSELAIEQPKKRFNFGFVTRMCLVLLVVMAGVKFEQISLWSAIVAIFVVQLLTIPVSIVISLRKKN